MQVRVEGARGTEDPAGDANGVTAEGSDGWIEGEEVGAAFAIRGEAAEAVGDDLVFALEERTVPEYVVSEGGFEGAADGIDGVGGEAAGLVVELGRPGFGHDVGAGVGVVDTGVAGGLALAFGRAVAGRFPGVRSVGCDLFIRDASEGHGD